MFRLVDNNFEENKDLKDLAVFCLTETIKNYVSRYFLENQDTENIAISSENVDIEKCLELFEDKTLESMKKINVNPKVFIPKKIVQFMDILNSKEEITPDIFIEYILYKMIKNKVLSVFILFLQ